MSEDEAVTRDVLHALTGRSIVWITHQDIGLAAMDRLVALQTGVSDLHSYARE